MIEEPVAMSEAVATTTTTSTNSFVNASASPKTTAGKRAVKPVKAMMLTNPARIMDNLSLDIARFDASLAERSPGMSHK